MYASDISGKISVIDKIKWLAMVAGDSRLSRAELAICCNIADRADKKGIAYPGVARLAKEINCLPRGTKKALNSLRKRGVLLVHEEGTRTKATRYRINLDYEVVSHRTPQGSVLQDRKVVSHRTGGSVLQDRKVVSHRTPESLRESIQESNQYNQGVFSSEFLEFWEAYPSKVGQDEAYREWQKAITKADPYAIINAARDYAESDKGQSQYVRSPKNWLCAGNWKDKPSEWQLKSKPKSESQYADLVEENRLEDERWRQTEQARNDPLMKRYTLIIQPEQDHSDVDGIRRLRLALKRMLRIAGDQVHRSKRNEQRQRKRGIAWLR
jgi:hypothetical protein